MGKFRDPRLSRPTSGPSADKADSSDDQPLLSHLLELRGRLLKIVVAVLVAFVVQLPFAGKIYGFVALPLVKKLPIESTLIATGAAAPFLAPFKLVMVLAIFLAMPWILFQIWGFVAPGLYAHERRMALPMIAAGTLLFYLGALFAWFVVMPLFFGFMATIGPEQVRYLPDISNVLDVMLKLFVGFGLAFQVPIAIVLLIYSRAVEVAKLKQWRPFIFLGCFVVGMLLTPPDFISQTLLALPMYVLFEIGLLVGSRIDTRDRQPQPES